MKLFPIILILIFCFTVFGQDEKASLNSWRGLTLDVSTFEDAKKVLGEPVKDKQDQYFIPLMYSKWFGNKPQKIFRAVKFKNIEGFDSVTLYFKDNKLVAIDMDMKKDLTASALTTAYDSRFIALVGNYAEGITPTDLADQKREVIYERNFPLAYHMGAANDKTIGLAMASVSNMEAFASGLSRQSGYALGAGLPGLVRRIQLISRTLENTKGVNLLK